jgi:hypothetical protein
MDLPHDAGAPQGEPASTASNDIPHVDAPSIDPAASEPASIAAEAVHHERIEPEAMPAPAAKARPAMPRAAVLVVRPDDKAGPEAPEAAAPAAPRSSGRRFALLAAGLTLAAAVGAIAGSAGIAGFERLYARAPVAVATHSEANDEVRVLKETVAQLRTNVKTLSDNLTALRTSINTSATAANAQFIKITEALDRVERAKNERHVTTLTPSPEPTGTVAAAPPAAADPKPVAKPPIVEGWSLRKVYGSDAALVEGRYGVVEVEPGDLVPGLGRIQEIKRQDGHWVIVTSRGLIVSSR